MSLEYTPLTEWFYVGQRVQFTQYGVSRGLPPGFATVKKVAKKNYQVTPDGDVGSGRFWNVPISHAAKFMTKVDAAEAPPKPVVESAPRPPFGSTVIVDTTKVKKTPDGLYIVFGWARDGEFSKLLRLDQPNPDGTYWTVPNRALTVVQVRVAEVVTD